VNKKSQKRDLSLR